MIDTSYLVLNKYIAEYSVIKSEHLDLRKTALVVLKISTSASNYP